MKHRLCPGCGEVTEKAQDGSWIHSDDKTPECEDE